jgi:hypothetical protein
MTSEPTARATSSFGLLSTGLVAILLVVILPR